MSQFYTSVTQSQSHFYLSAESLLPLAVTTRLTLNPREGSAVACKRSKTMFQMGDKHFSVLFDRQGSLTTRLTRVKLRDHAMVSTLNPVAYAFFQGSLAKPKKILRLSHIKNPLPSVLRSHHRSSISSYDND